MQKEMEVEVEGETLRLGRGGGGRRLKGLTAQALTLALIASTLIWFGVPVLSSHDLGHLRNSAVGTTPAAVLSLCSVTTTSHIKGESPDIRRMHTKGGVNAHIKQPHSWVHSITRCLCWKRFDVTLARWIVHILTHALYS